MKYLLVWMVCMLSGLTGMTRQWSGYAGAGINYDCFLRDRSVTERDKWPFQVGAGILGGIGYRTENGFNVFADASLGLLRVQYPVPEMKEDGLYQDLLQARFMIGSGPKIDVGQRGNFITPFLQLGASYIDPYGNSSSGSSGSSGLVIHNEDYTRNWHILCGVGIDWQFEAMVPSSLNFQCTYTPLAVYRDPVAYTAVVGNEQYDRLLQGKLLQVMLSYRVHFYFKKAQ